ncbi:MAG: hypothetical protein FWD40_02315 [Treponema sp.]|nr:hypothetical protein [Treponema sp.]
MPWRLIVFIIIFAVFLMFITFNLENSCDINFGFIKLEKVPVFITVFSSFVLGLFCALPLVMHIKSKRKEKKLKEEHKKHDAPIIEENLSDSVDPKEARKKFLARKRGGNDA